MLYWIVFFTGSPLKPGSFFFNFFSLSVSVYVFLCVHAGATAHIWRAEGNFQELVLTSHYEGLRN